MDKKKSITLYVLLLVLSILIFTLVLVFDANGILGFIICMSSILLIIGCVIKLCRLSEKFKNWLINFIDLLFWLP